MKRALCTPVGPSGLSPLYYATTVPLFAWDALQAHFLAETHVVPGRNHVWQAAVAAGAERVLWLDADVGADAAKLAEWMDIHDRHFDIEPRLAAVGATVLRRGGGGAPARAYYEPEPGADQAVMLGMGLTYWHVPRVLAALQRGERDPEAPFRWVPPYSEDFEVSRFLQRHGAWQGIDDVLATSHVGVGDWEGRAL